MIRVVIADDHAQVRTALRRVLEIEADFEVVGEARDGEGAVQAAERTRPDLVVLDYRMPRLNGVDAAREIVRRLPDVALIMLSGDEDDEVATEAVRAGVSNYVSKSGAPEDLLTAMRRAATEPRSA